jgi:hypothetical protein
MIKNRQMRKPFLLFLGLISLYCWLTDLIGFLFYATCVQPAHKNAYSHAGSALILLAGLFTGWYFLKKRDTSREWLKTIFHTNKKEWLLLGAVSMPVILLGLFRSIFPDQNFDTFHFELYLQEFDFNENKVNFGAGAIRTYYFPLPERVFGLFRHIVGYRLGTFFNTFLLVAIIASIYDFIKKFIAFNESNRHYKIIIVGLLSLFAVLADNTLFTMGSYKPDLIGLPFLLELIHLVLDKPAPRQKTSTYVYFFLLASLTITFKLTFLPYVGILCLVYFIRHFKLIPVLQWLCIPLVIFLFGGTPWKWTAQARTRPPRPVAGKNRAGGGSPSERVARTARRDQRTASCRSCCSLRAAGGASQLPPMARISPTVAWYWAERTCSAWRRLRSSLRRASSNSSWLTSPLR